MGLDWDNLSGETKTAKIRELLLDRERKGKLDELLDAIATERPNLQLPHPDSQQLECPYRGLSAFQEKDKHLFFGRDRFSDQLVEKVQSQPLTAVVGPSGSGKSSVVFAGLVPKLRNNGDWLIIHMRPGNNPFQALASTLLPHYDPALTETDRLIESRKLTTALQDGTLPLTDILTHIQQKQPDNTNLLLIIDQFEELYTLCQNADERHRFLDLVVKGFSNQVSGFSQSTTENRKHLVMTLRADFMGQALAYPLMVDALQNSDIKLGPMADDDLQQAIAAPAQKVGVSFESGLVERIMDDVGSEENTLPLLEFALTELWRWQTHRQLTHVAYEQIGQVKGALAKHADQVFAKLSMAEQAQARRVFVQLVHPGAGTEDTRRIAHRTEFDDADWTLVQKLADFNTRLLVTDQPKEDNETAEVIHEALIQRWGQLKQWMDANRTFRLWQERLRLDIERWEANNQDQDALLRGAPLAEAEGWLLSDRHELLSEIEKAYITEGVTFRDEKALAKEAQRQRELEQERQRTAAQRKANTQLRIVAILAVVAAAVAIFLGWKSFSDGKTAVAQGQARTLAAASDRLRLNNDTRKGLVFAYQAVNETYQRDKTLTAEAFNSLQASLSATHVDGQLFGHTAPVLSAVFSTDGTRILTASGGFSEIPDNTARLWDANGNPLATLDGHTAPVLSAVFSTDGTRILTASSDNTARLWDANGNPLATLDGHTDWVLSAVFSTDGTRILTASDDNTARLWDANGNPLATLDGHTDWVLSAVFSTDGTRILTASDDNTARLWPHYPTAEGMMAEAKRRLLILLNDSECLELFDAATCENR